MNQEPTTIHEIQAIRVALWREYEAFIESMVEHCHCEPESYRPCDGVLAGGVCDGEKVDRFEKGNT